MPTRISEFGSIGRDGRLRIPMDRLNELFAQHKGKRVIARFEIYSPGTTELQLAYYRNYIVPTCQQALYKLGERKTELQVDLWLREQCGICYNDYGQLMDAREMSMEDFSEFLEWLKQFAAENLYVYIEDPKTI